MKKNDKLKLIIGILSIIIFILLILLLFNNKALNNNIIINNLSSIMQLLSYIATTIGAASIVFAYIQYKNIKEENNNKISNETIDMLNDFATKVIPYIEYIDKRCNILNNNILSNKNICQVCIKAQALNDLTDEINYIDFWCERFFIFKKRNMIQEEVLYNEDHDVFIDFFNDYVEAFKYNDSHNRYYQPLYMLYNRWTNTNFHNMDNK